jgi:hypothetical protein
MSTTLLTLTTSGVLSMHGFEKAYLIFFPALLSVVYAMTL